MLLFFRPQQTFFPGMEIQLSKEEIHHLRVYRNKTDVLFGNGESEHWRAEIHPVPASSSSKRKRQNPTLGNTPETDKAVLKHCVRKVQEPMRILACALPEKSRLYWLAEKATELGLTHFFALQCEYGNRQVTLDESLKARLSRICLSAASQSKRFSLPKFYRENNITELLSSVQQTLSEVSIQFLRCSPTPMPTQNAKAKTEVETLANANLNLASDDLLHRQVARCYIIGGEGGFSPQENQTLEHIPTLSFSPQILRVETAAIVALALDGIRWD